MMIEYHRIEIHLSAYSAEFVETIDANVSVDIRPIWMSRPIILRRRWRRRKVLLRRRLVMLVRVSRLGLMMM
jgi:hypothetical protein